MARHLDWDAVRAQIAPLVEAGLSRAEMVQALGIPLGTLSFRLDRLGLTRPRQCSVWDRSTNHSSEKRTTSGRGSEYISSPGRVEKDSIRRRCCRCRKSFIADSRFLFRCAPCRRGDE
ncbi:hypothetical protein LDL36_03185 [Komagataeibacter sp. FNDCR1]|nr:hypothetical protein [Komagataeibacter sp. FNDCR1]